MKKQRYSPLPPTRETGYKLSVTKPLPVKRITVVSRFGKKSRSWQCDTNRFASGLTDYELACGATKITLTVEWVKPTKWSDVRRARSLPRRVRP
jgi:hypothetical protein